MYIAKIKTFLIKVRSDYSAITSIEYSLLAAVIAIVAIVAFVSLAAEIEGLFNGVHSSFSDS